MIVLPMEMKGSQIPIGMSNSSISFHLVATRARRYHFETVQPGQLGSPDPKPEQSGRRILWTVPL